jgi:hypothetical protein
MVLAAHRAEVTERGRRRVVGALLTGAALLVLYWAAWLLDRSLLASDTRPAYYEFEAAFALADAWLAFCLVAGARALAAGGPRPCCGCWPPAGRPVPAGRGRALQPPARRLVRQPARPDRAAAQPGHRGRDGRPVRLDLAAAAELLAGD